MGLPSNPRPTETVQLGDIAIAISGLHLFQIRELATMDPDASDAQAIAWATGCTPDEAHDWIEQSSGGDAVALMAAIMRLSGWDTDGPKRFPS